MSQLLMHGGSSSEGDIVVDDSIVGSNHAIVQLITSDAADWLSCKLTREKKVTHFTTEYPGIVNLTADQLGCSSQLES